MPARQPQSTKLKSAEDGVMKVKRIYEKAGKEQKR